MCYHWNRYVSFKVADACGLHKPLFLVGTLFCFSQSMTNFHLITLKLKYEYFLSTACVSYKPDNSAEITIVQCYLLLT